MPKETKIVSLSLEPDMHELIKVSAKKLGHKNVSQLIRDLVSRYLDLMTNERDETPVIIRVPNELKGDDLKDWLRRKSDAISEALSNG